MISSLVNQYENWIASKQASYLVYRETLRLCLFWFTGWDNFLCLQSQISLNLSVNKSNWCYCLTKSVLVLLCVLVIHYSIHSFLDPRCKRALYYKRWSILDAEASREDVSSNTFAIASSKVLVSSAAKGIVGWRLHWHHISDLFSLLS